MAHKADTEIDISVIVPVFNDAERLKLCLQALEHQTYPKERYEVIVVDNGSKDGSADAAALFEHVSLVHEQYPGSYSARNKGISVAKGDVLAFTDSDCIPSTVWLEVGHKAVSAAPRCGLVAGKIDFFFKDPNSLTAVEVYESIELDFSQEKFLTTEQFGVTANLFTTKEVLEVVGIFNPDLKSGGDRDWGQRVFKAGYEQIYAKEAVVRHPARYSWWQLYKRVTRFAGGSHDVVQSELSALERLSKLIKYCGLATTPPFRSLLRSWKDERLKTRQQKLKFIFAALFVRYVSAWEHIRLQLGGQSRRW